MARLGHFDLKTLSEVLLELYSPCPPSDLPVRFFNLLRRCIPFDFLGYHEIIDNRNQRSVIYPEYPFDHGAFAAYLHQHPTWNGIVGDQLLSPVKISDFLTQNRWRHTDLYNYIFRPCDQNHQLAFITLDERPQLGIALNRSIRDFSEEERSVLNLLKPHVSQAFAASTLFSYLSDASSSVTEGYLVVDGNGKILFGTDRALSWLQQYFAPIAHGLLPTRLRDWLFARKSAFSSSDSGNLAARLRDFSIVRDSKRLVVASISPLQASAQRLLLREENRQANPQLLQRLGLTKREAEVLLWVSEGKRNCEIATILGTTAKTVTKHLERVFAKLGVENRTTAAAMALQVLLGASQLG